MIAALLRSVDAAQRRLRFSSQRITVVRLLSRSMKREDFNSVLLHCADPRDVLSTVAKVLEIPLPAVLEEVASLLKVRCVAALPPVSISLLERLCPEWRLEQYSRIGFLPLLEDGRVNAIACVDPASADELVPALRSYPKVLVPWPVLRRALHADSSLKVDPTEHGAHSHFPASELLAALIHEAQRWNATTLRLNIGEKGSDPRYEMLTTTLRRATGTIDPSIAEPLSTLCGRLLNNPEDPLPYEWRVSEYKGGIYTLRQKGASSPSPTGLSSGDSISQGDRVSKDLARPFVNHHATTPDVLIVEDQGVYGAVLRRYLERQSLTSEHCQNGEEALTLLQSGRCTPRLIVSDVHMPKMEGDTLLKALKSSPTLERIPVIMLTSDTNPEVEAKLILDGAHACLRKSEDSRVVSAYVVRFLAPKQGKVS